MNKKSIDLNDLTDLSPWIHDPHAMKLCKSIQGLTDSQIKILSFGNEALEADLYLLKNDLNLVFLGCFAETVVRVYQSGRFYDSAHYEDHFNSDGRPAGEFRAALFKIEAIEELTEITFNRGKAPWYRAWVQAMNLIWPHQAVRNDEQLYWGEFNEESNYDW